jgi:riboflavin synthase alpha subunit
MRYLITDQDHNEREFELHVEKIQITLDELLKGKKITQEEYDLEIQLLDKYIERFYNI